MIKLLKRKIQFIKNWIIKLKSSPWTTIKLSLKYLIVKRFYNTFSWVIGFLIFSPALFDEHPLERLRDILKWLKENFVLTCFHITNILRNKMADILNYFGFKNTLYSRKDSWFGNLNPFSGEPKRPPYEPPAPPRPDYEALWKKHDQEWKRKMRESYPGDRDIKFPLDVSNPYHWLYVSIFTASLAVASSYVWYNWDYIAPIFHTLNIPAISLPTIATIYTSSRDYISAIYDIVCVYWRRTPDLPIGGDDVFKDLERPHQVDLSDDRTESKGKGKASASTSGGPIDAANTTRRLSHEELSAIDPHNETRSNPANTGVASDKQSTVGGSTVVPETFAERLERSNAEFISRKEARRTGGDPLNLGGYPIADTPYSGRHPAMSTRGPKALSVRDIIFSVPDSDTSSSDSSSTKSPVLTAALADNPFTATTPKSSSPILDQTKDYWGKRDNYEDADSDSSQQTARTPDSTPRDATTALPSPVSMTSSIGSSSTIKDTTPLNTGIPAPAKTERGVPMLNNVLESKPLFSSTFQDINANSTFKLVRDSEIPHGTRNSGIQPIHLGKAFKKVLMTHPDGKAEVLFQSTQDKTLWRVVDTTWLRATDPKESFFKYINERLSRS